MNVEIGAEAAQFPEKEYIIGISLQCRDPTPSVQKDVFQFTYPKSSGGGEVEVVFI